MKRLCVVLGFVVSGVMAAGVAAQGPAGAGASAAAGQKAESSHSSHSYNPIKWIKKDKKAPETADNGDQMRKLTARLQGQGIVASNQDVNGLCKDFKELDSCLAALHASHSLGLDFACVRSNVTGVKTGVDASGCKMADSDKPQSLSKTIKLLKPDADIKNATKDAETQAKEDLRDTAS